MLSEQSFAAVIKAVASRNLRPIDNKKCHKNPPSVTFVFITHWTVRTVTLLLLHRCTSDICSHMHFSCFLCSTFNFCRYFVRRTLTLNTAAFVEKHRRIKKRKKRVKGAIIANEITSEKLQIHFNLPTILPEYILINTLRTAVINIKHGMR